MKLKSNVILLTAIVTMLTFAACKKTDVAPLTTESQSSLEVKMSENGTNPDEAIFSNPVSNVSSLNHFYIESNKKNKNTIFVFTQKPNGQIVLEDEVASGGYGSGEGLGSQGALCVSKDYNLLFAVNPGSNSVSSFRINSNTGGLKLLFTATTNGQLPNSVTVHGNKLFVLNNLSSSICGFTFSANGFISPIPGSEHKLSGMNVDAPQIKFQPDGYAIYVTEKKTDLIDKFSLNDDGAVTSVIQIPSHGVEPFGFDYAREGKYMIVSNAGDGASGAGSTTSYKFTNSGLDDINGAVSNYETAPCWVATTKHGAFAFVANAGSNSISSYYIDRNGVLTLIKAVAAQDGKVPLDLAVSPDNKFVYSFYSGSHSVVAYKRMPAGVIEYADKVTVLPAYAAGLAVY